MEPLDNEIWEKMANEYSGQVVDFDKLPLKAILRFYSIPLYDLIDISLKGKHLSSEDSDLEFELGRGLAENWVGKIGGPTLDEEKTRGESLLELLPIQKFPSHCWWVDVQSFFYWCMRIGLDIPSEDAEYIDSNKLDDTVFPRRSEPVSNQLERQKDSNVKNLTLYGTHPDLLAILAVDDDYRRGRFEYTQQMDICEELAKCLKVSENNALVKGIAARINPKRG